MSKDKIQGEGNYEAAKEYDDKLERFVKSGKVEEAARAAAPRNDQEAEEMKRAEDVGRSHSHGEDPLLQGDNPGQKPPATPRS